MRSRGWFLSFFQYLDSPYGEPLHHFAQTFPHGFCCFSSSSRLFEILRPTLLDSPSLCASNEFFETRKMSTLKTHPHQLKLGTFFFEKFFNGIDSSHHSEQLFQLELLLKMRSYSSGNRRNF